MRALLVAVALLAGCTMRQKIAGGGVGVAVIGLGLTYSGEARTEASTQEKVGVVLMLTGLVTLFVAAALDETEKRDAPKQISTRRPATSETPEQRAQIKAQHTRDRAWVLTKQAQEAARLSDCTKVTELSAQVGALDAEFYADVFMMDVAIQHCFVPAEPPPGKSSP